jgi:hypothetical protein
MTDTTLVVREVQPAVIEVASPGPQGVAKSAYDVAVDNGFVGTEQEWLDSLGGATWDTLQGKPATFPPSAHTHQIADVTGLQAELDGKEAAGTAAAAVAGLTKASVGLGSVDNTSDAEKPISTAQQAALDGKDAVGAATAAVAAHEAALDPHPQYTTASEAASAAPVQSVAGKTGAVTLGKVDVGLGNVDNTSDASKPVSTAQQAALNAKQDTLVSGTNIKTVNGNSVLGAGNIAVAATPAGATTQVQYNKAGAFFADAALSFDDTTGKLYSAQFVANDSSSAPGFRFFGSNSGLRYNAASDSGRIFVYVNGSDRFAFGTSGPILAGSTGHGLKWTDGAQTSLTLTAGLSWSASNVLEVNNGSAGSFADLKLRNLKPQVFTVATLPSASTAGNGARSHVSDASAPTFGATVSGGGTVSTPVYSDGTNWKVG